MIKDRNQAISHSRWFLPSFSLGLGVVVLAASSGRVMATEIMVRTARW